MYKEKPEDKKVDLPAASENTIKEWDGINFKSVKMNSQWCICQFIIYHFYTIIHYYLF